MNQIVGRGDSGRDFVVLQLEPSNLKRLREDRPVKVRLEDLFPDGIPKRLDVLVAYTDTPEADARRLLDRAEVVLDERTPRQQAKRPICPKCEATIETLGIYRSEAPVEICFCPTCGCVLGVLPRMGAAQETPQ